jgi:hypothetical protein
VLSLSGAVVRGLGLRRQRQLRVGGDVSDTPVVAYETDLAVASLEPHYGWRTGDGDGQPGVRGARDRSGIPRAAENRRAVVIQDSLYDPTKATLRA